MNAFAKSIVWKKFSVRSLLILVSCSAVFFAYAAACRRADRTPRTVSGRIVTRTGEPISNAIVVARDSDPLPSSTLTEVVVQLGDTGLLQSTHVIRPGANLTIENVGTRGCCIYAQPIQNAPISKIVKPGCTVELPITEAERMPFVLSGTIRGEVKGWVLPTDFPSCVTNIRGEYHLEGILPGSREIEVWDVQNGRTRHESYIPRFSQSVETIAP